MVAVFEQNQKLINLYSIQNLESLLQKLITDIKLDSKECFYFRLIHQDPSVFSYNLIASYFYSFLHFIIETILFLMFLLNSSFLFLMFIPDIVLDSSIQLV